MTEAVKPTRRYHAPRREEQARRSRRDMLDAGRRLFLEHGYAATTVGMVADEAGVATQTVYKVFRNKPGLVKAIVDVAIVGDDEPVPMMEREFVRKNMAEPDPEEAARLRRPPCRRRAPRRRVAARRAGRGGRRPGCRERLAADAGRAAHRHDGLRAPPTRRETLASRGDRRSRRDILWAHSSVELWDLLVNQRGWTIKRYGRWIGDQLVAALL